MTQLGAQIEFEEASAEFTGESGRVTACADVNLSIEPGQSVAVIGPSGCGKSTTLRMLAGLVAPATGSVRVNGEPCARPRRETAFIPQDLGLLPWKSVVENAALGLRLQGVPAAEARRRAGDALAQVGLTGFERAFPKELSGGMRQRLALARGLATQADLLLMDEPLSAIDALLRESLQETLLALWQERGHTQVLVTHSIEEAVFLGQRIVVFSEHPGRVVADVPNPQVGQAGWRDSAAFAETCVQVRRALAGKLTGP